jgi:hypothetical protein
MRNNLDEGTVAPPAKPEVDPELAALEAGRVERFVSNLIQKAAEVRKIHNVGVKSRVESRDKRGGSHGRAARRALARSDSGPDPRTRPHARLGRAKPVKSPQQWEWERQRAIQPVLSKVKLTMLLTECPEIKFVAGTPGLKNAWQLARATSETIHAIQGLGPARRKRIHAYLTGKNVPVVWKP